MMVTDLRCWWQNHCVGDSFRYVGDFLNLNRSPTSQTCHQHIGSPTFVTNIDVTNQNLTALCLNYRFLRVPISAGRQPSVNEAPGMGASRQTQRIFR